MPKRLAIRLLVIPLILAVFSLGAQSVSHFDGSDHDEAHCTCQVCHIAHAAIPRPATQAQLQVPLRFARFAPSEKAASAFESANILSIPRAPPV